MSGSLAHGIHQARAAEQLWARRRRKSDREKKAECLKKRRWRMSTEYKVTYMFLSIYIRLSRDNK